MCVEWVHAAWKQEAQAQCFMVSAVPSNLVVDGDSFRGAILGGSGSRAPPFWGGGFVRRTVPYGSVLRPQAVPVRRGPPFRTPEGGRERRAASRCNSCARVTRRSVHPGVSRNFRRASAGERQRSLETVKGRVPRFLFAAREAPRGFGRCLPWPDGGGGGVRNRPPGLGGRS